MDKGKLYPGIMLGLPLLLPVTVGLLSLPGYELRLHHPLVPMVLVTGVFGGAAMAALRLKSDDGKRETAMYGTAVLFGVCHFFFVMFYCHTIPEMALALLWIVLAAVVWCRRWGSTLRKVLRAVAAAGLCTLAVFVGTVGFFAAQIGETTVVREISSPDGQYRAQVADVDRGALGGDTAVWVSRRGGLNLYFFEIADRRELVYLGPWGMAETLNVEWTHERQMAVNGVVYEIK